MNMSNTSLLIISIIIMAIGIYFIYYNQKVEVVVAQVNKKICDMNNCTYTLQVSDNIITITAPDNSDVVEGNSINIYKNPCTDNYTINDPRISNYIVYSLIIIPIFIIFYILYKCFQEQQKKKDIVKAIIAPDIVKTKKVIDFFNSTNILPY